MRKNQETGYKGKKRSRWGERGNVFFTLFGAVALVGMIGAATATLMRGPLGTVVTLNQRAKADAQMQIGQKLALLQAARQTSGAFTPDSPGDCDNDTFIEPLPPKTASCSPSPTGGGCIPDEIGASKNDPWGTNYGYCAWDHGATTCGITGLLDGENIGDKTVISLISAGPDRAFQLSCADAPAYVSTDPNSDDIVLSVTYDQAAESAGGLWYLKSGSSQIATIDRDVEISKDARFKSGADFEGSTMFNAGSVTNFDAGSVLDMTSGGLFNLPTQTSPGSTDADCTAAQSPANLGLLRVDTSMGAVLQICDPGPPPLQGWINVGGTAGVGRAAGSDTQIQFNDNPNLGADADFTWNKTTNTLAITGIENITGTLNVSSNTTVGGTFDVTGSLAVNTNQFNVDAATGNTLIAGTLGVTGATTLSDTLHTVGAATLDSTLDVTGDVAVNTDKFNITAATGNTAIAGDVAVATNKFNIAAATGNTLIAGTLGVTGAATLSNTLSVTGISTFLQDIQAKTGTGADPGVTFTADSSTGLYLAAGSRLGFTAGGVGAMWLDSTADAAGRIGIGVATPTVKLDVYGAIRPGLDLVPTICSDPDTLGAIRYNAAADALDLCSKTGNGGGVGWVTIGTMGAGGVGSGGGGVWTKAADNRIYYNTANVGIGTSTPAEKLHTVGRARFDDIYIGTWSSNSRIESNNASTFYVGTGVAQDMIFNTNAANVMTLKSGGNVGIGTTAPGAKLDVFGGSSIFRLSGTDDTVHIDPQAAGSGGNIYVTNSANNAYRPFGFQASQFLFSPGGVEAMRLDSSGALLVGTQVRSGALLADIEGPAGATMFCDADGANCFEAADVFSGGVGGSGAGSDRQIMFNNAGALAGDANFVFSAVKNVGIGIAAPADRLHLNFSAPDIRRALAVTDETGAQAVMVPTGTGVLSSYAHFGYDFYASSPSQLTARGGMNSPSGIGFGSGIHLWTTGVAVAGGTNITPLDRLTIDLNGQVGIGTAAPSSRLTLKSPASGSESFVLEGAVTGAKLVRMYESANDGYIEARTGGDAVVSRISGYTGTPTYFLSTVGIGTTGPNSLLHVYSATAAPGSNGIAKVEQVAATNYPTLVVKQNTAGGNAGDQQGLVVDVAGTAQGRALDVLNSGTSRFTVLNNGNVGIGTTAPNTLMHLYKSTDSSTARDYLRLDNNGYSNAYIGLQGYNFYINSAANTAGGFVYNVATNNVGIGTASPSAKLQVEGAPGSNALYLSTGGAGSDLNIAYGGSNEIVSIGSWSVGGLHFYSTCCGYTNPADGSIQLYPRSGNIVAKGTLTVNGTITSGGVQVPVGTGTGGYIPKWTAAGSLGNSVMYDNGTNIGIGTTSPASQLEIHAATGSIFTDGLRVSRDGPTGATQYTTYNYAGGALELTAVNSAGTGTGIYFRRSNDGVTSTTSMMIDTNGRVGIGTTSPIYRTVVNGTLQAGYVLLGDNNNNSNNTIEFANPNTTTYTIGHINYYGGGYLTVGNGGGGVIIGGSSAPSYKLHVLGDIYANGGWLRVSGNTGLYFESWGGGWFMQDSTWIRSYNSKPVFMSAGYDSSSPSGVGCGGGLGGGYTFQVCGDLLANNWVDRNNGSYYVDPNGTSSINAMYYNNLYWQGNSAYGFIDRNVYADTINTGSAGDPLELNYYRAGDIRFTGGDLTMNSGYYVYPGSISGAGAFQKSYYIASHSSYGLYTNTGMEFDGGVYLQGYRMLGANTSYGTVNLYTAKNGYYGVLFGPGGTSYPNLMFDGAGNGGIYYENWGWATYYLTGSRHMQINTSSDLGYSLGVSGNFTVTAESYLPGGVHSGANLLNWPGYNGLAQTTGHYVWPGSYDRAWQQNWYLRSGPDWGLYTNTSFMADGGLYDQGARVLVRDRWIGSNYYGSNGDMYLTWKGTWLSTDLGNIWATFGNYFQVNTWQWSHYFGSDGATYGSVFYYSSDERLKENVKTIPNALDSVLKLRGVTFNWKEDGRADVGVIAQEVEKVYPQLVREAPETGMKSVEYGNLIGPLIEAIKEQQKMIDFQQKAIEELQKEVKALGGK